MMVCMEGWMGGWMDGWIDGLPVVWNKRLIFLCWDSYLTAFRVQRYFEESNIWSSWWKSINSWLLKILIDVNKSNYFDGIKKYILLQNHHTPCTYAAKSVRKIISDTTFKIDFLKRFVKWCFLVLKYYFFSFSLTYKKNRTVWTHVHPLGLTCCLL